MYYHQLIPLLFHMMELVKSQTFFIKIDLSKMLNHLLFCLSSKMEHSLLNLYFLIYIYQPYINYHLNYLFLNKTIFKLFISIYQHFNMHCYFLHYEILFAFLNSISHCLFYVQNLI